MSTKDAPCNRIKNFQDFVGQETIKHSLLSRIKRRQVGHAYLFAGPSGQGKRTLAHIFAAGILCHTPSVSLGPCGQCASCRKFEADLHPDFYSLGGPDQPIKIHEVRKLKQTVMFSPSDSAYKVYLVENAENMTRESANSLLKILEEPPSYVVFILTATQIRRILPTVISRCEYYQLGAYAREELEEILAKDNQEAFRKEIRKAAEEARGSLERARKILSEAHYQTLEEKADQLVLQLPYLKLPTLLDWAEEIGQEEFLEDFLSLLNQGFYEKMLKHREEKDFYGIEKASRSIEIVLATQGKLQTNANRLLALEAMLLEIKEVLENGKMSGRRREV